VNASDKKRWYLVIIKFSEGSDTLLERLKRDLPTIEATLKKLSDDSYKVLTRSNNGQMASWVLRTAVDSKQISNRIYNPEGTKLDLHQRDQRAPDSARAGDAIVVLQLSEDRCLTGLNVIQSWFDRHWND
jgi:hypothetical protein